jgi:hypothetical protein
MKTIDKFKVLLLPVFVLILLLLVGGFGPSFAESSELSAAVFTVQ